MFKKILFLLLFSFISACSTNYTVSTNLDKQNFTDYFSAPAVQVYDNEQALPPRHKFITSVEGQDCQEQAHHAPPDRINARTQARKRAYEKKANAIIFSGCAVLTQEDLAQLSLSSDARQCHAITICYGKAYLVNDDSLEK